MNKSFKLFQYAYLIFAVVFFYQVVSKYITTGVVDTGSLLLGAAAVFMFFFRQKFNKKFNNKD